MLSSNVKKIAFGGTIFDRSYAGATCKLHTLKDGTTYMYPILNDTDWQDWEFDVSKTYSVLGKINFYESDWYLVQGYFSYTINDGANTAFPDDALCLIRGDMVELVGGVKSLTVYCHKALRLLLSRFSVEREVA